MSRGMERRGIKHGARPIPGKIARSLMSDADAALYWDPYNLGNLKMLPEDCRECGHEFHERPCKERVPSGYASMRIDAPCPCSVGRPLTDLYGRPER